MGRPRKLSALDTIKAMAKEQESAAPAVNGKIPNIATQPNVSTAIDAYIEASSDAKDAEARMKEAKEVILPVAIAAHETVIQDMNEFHSSIVLDDKLMFTAQNKYRAVDEDVVKANFTDDECDKFFSESVAVTLKSKFTEDEAVLGELLKVLGAQRFAELFDVKTTLKPNDEFHRQRYLDKDLCKKVAVVVANTGQFNPTHVLKVR